VSVPGWPIAFRGSLAVAAGLVTKDVLRGPRFARLFPDTYVAAGRKQDLELRSHAAYRYVEGRGVLSGFSAAEVLGASCGPEDAPAEVTVPHGKQRDHPGLLVHRNALAPGEMQRYGGLRTTTPLRTAYDLARRGTLVERVVAVDALARAHLFSPDLLLNFAVHFPRARGNDAIPEVLAYADRRAGSPMETRLRLLLVFAGLPRPQTQWVVQDDRARRAVWLDLAYPEHMIGIEYEGEGHTTPDGVLRDIGRGTDLVDKGWRIYRYTKYEILGEPEKIVAQITRALSGTRSTSAGSAEVRTPLT
jgi:very-short-patch-repair endonuclease